MYLNSHLVLKRCLFAIILTLSIIANASDHTSCFNVINQAFEEHRTTSLVKNQPPPPSRSRSDWEALSQAGVNLFQHRIGDIIKLGPFTLKILGLLGSSASTVYLVETSNQRFVSKKHNTKGMFYFELRLTEFLLENGFDVPKIIYHEGQSQLVKDYFAGLTYNEVLGVFKNKTNEKFGWVESDLSLLQEELKILHQTYAELVNGRFAEWLKSHYPNDLALIQTDNPRLLAQGDMNLQNYVYSFTERRWRKYDP